jgi:hypothetical protein
MAEEKYTKATKGQARKNSWNFSIAFVSVAYDLPRMLAISLSSIAHI